MAEPRYPSWTRAERAKQKRIERQREAELLKRVNERLAACKPDRYCNRQVSIMFR